MTTVRFIKLHTAEENKTVVLNTTMFVIAQREGDNTKVVYKDDESMTTDVTVNETPEKICTMIPGKCIKVHNADDNRVACVNIDYIRVIREDSSGEGTELSLFDDSFSVNETPERLLNAINTLQRTKDITVDNNTTRQKIVEKDIKYGPSAVNAGEVKKK